MYDAAIFDLDGTLTDNMRMHGESFDIFVAKHGLPAITKELRLRLDGKRNRDIFPILFDRELPDAELRAYAGEKESAYRELSRGRLRTVDGAVEFLDHLDRMKVPFGIATSAPELNVEHTLRELDLQDRFSITARSDEVPRGKPYPDVFIEAARRLGVAPERCVAFEDAPAGIVAAKAADMTCVAIATTFSESVLREEAAPDHVIVDYREVASLLGF